MDIFGTLSGIVAGAAFAPFNPKARADYLVQGATGGVGRPWEAVSSGIGGTVGYAILQKKGLVEGVKGGIGAIPHIAGEGILEIPKAVENFVLDPIIMVGAFVLLIMLTKE